MMLRCAIVDDEPLALGLLSVSATRTHFVLKEIKNMYSAIPEEEKRRF